MAKDFEEVLERIQEEGEIHKLSKKIDTLLYNQNVKDSERRITINGTETNIVLHVSEILYCRADVNCTFFYMTNGKKVFSSKTLKIYDEWLSDSDFYRIHQSYLVNLKYVEQFTKGKPTFVILSNGEKIKVSLNSKTELLKRLNNINKK